MGDRKIFYIFVGLGVMLMAGCTLTTPQIDIDEGAVITIVEPVDAAQFQLGAIVKVRALVGSATGAKEIDLFINGDILCRDQLNIPLRKGSMLQPWQPVEAGDYLIQVQMTITDGKLVQSNAVLISVVGDEQQPVVDTQVTDQVSQPEDTIAPTFTPTETLTLTPIPTQTPVPTLIPTLTLAPTQTYTPSPEPLAAPVVIAPSGSLSCRSTVFLEWNPVYHPNGVAYYEWNVQGPGGVENGTTTETQVEYFLPSCAALYSWQVRAVDHLGTLGPYSNWLDFSIE